MVLLSPKLLDAYITLSLSCRRLMVKLCSSIYLFCCSISSCYLNANKDTESYRLSFYPSLQPSTSISYICIEITDLIILLTNSMLLARLLTQINPNEFHQPRSTNLEPLSISITTLTHIDETHFGHLNNLANNNTSAQEVFRLILKRIEEYLLERQLQKLQRQYIRQLLQRREGSELMEVVLLVGIKSQIRGKIIEEIMNCSQEEQQYLMNTIKTVQSKCYSLVGIKQVINRIQTLEQESQILREQCQRNEDFFIRQIQEVEEIQKQKTQFQAEINKYKQQKYEISAQLGFFEFKDFLQNCVSLKKQNTVIIESIANSLEDQQNLIEKNNYLKKQLHSYANIIKSHMEEAERLKNWYNLLKEQTAVDSIVHQSEKKDNLRLPLGDNTNILNIPICSSRKVGPHTDRTHYTEVLDLDQSFQLAKPLSIQLQIARLQEEQLLKQQELTQLQQSLKSELSKKKRLDKKMNTLRQTHEECMNLYAAV